MEIKQRGKPLFKTARLLTSLMFLLVVILTMSVTSHALTPWYASVGAHIVLLNPDGTVWCIGSNNHGQLGIGKTDSDIHEPVMVPDLRKVMAVAAGATHSVALLRDGTVWTWGGNEAGQLGIGNRMGSKIGSPQPVQVDGLRDVIAIASGRNHVVALKKDGTVWSWGSNFSGQLGLDSGGTADQPVQTAHLDGVIAITAGAFHTAALKKDGTVWSWGFNGNGQLGNGTCENYNIPVKVAGLGSVVAIAAGNQHTVALQNDGTAWAWGSNHASQLGGDSSSLMSLTPVQVSGLSGIIDITAKVNHTFALMKDGTVVAWGDTGSRQWGNGVSMGGSPIPVRLHGVSSPVSIAAIGNPDTLVKGRNSASIANALQSAGNHNDQAVNRDNIAFADASRFFRY
ncbi:MAG: RCC1 repeat- and reductase domain-containing protein [Geobacteraceae bacterium]|nr:RCC1 repeat- and reductase domain-containing protein [Geobacteraceae bacterium]